MARIRLTNAIADRAAPRAVDLLLRDSIVPGLILKVTPKGCKSFLLSYTTLGGRRRKPAIGRFGELTVERARVIAQEWLFEVRRGGDPADNRHERRHAATMKELCDRFITDYSMPKNTPRTIRKNQDQIRRYILPALGRMKARDVRRADIADLVASMKHAPTTANRVLCCLRKMFNMAEVWGYRDDFTNPSRHVPTYPEKGETRCITDDELVRIFDHLERAEREGLEYPAILLAVRLQFGFAARMSEILELRWDWVDFSRRRVAWPASKTGAISKPISSDVLMILAEARARQHAEGLDSPFVCPSLRDPTKPLPVTSYHYGWARILREAGVPHVGTHGIRHRAATDIANSGVPLKVGMQLTAHKTVSQFMRYVHPEDELVHAAAEHVARQRSIIIESIPRDPFHSARQPHRHARLPAPIGRDAS